MYDTVDCYNENDICEKCGKKPVENIHNGDLTGNKLTKLCRECFVELTRSKGK
jgi:hypothetical protein